MDLIASTRQLRKECADLRFAAPVAYVYRPLDYAWKPYSLYLRRFAHPGVEAILLGMNPGPFGMGQTGIPFGEVAATRDWLGLAAPVLSPEREHPKRPVLGFSCPRSEVSGRRLWSWARSRFGDPKSFFQSYFVLNYCPLLFLEEGGRNRTPDKLPADERTALEGICDRALRAAVAWLRPRMVVGIGRFAETRARRALASESLPCASILHPSPANPAANRGWEVQAETALLALGLPTRPRDTRR